MPVNSEASKALRKPLIEGYEMNIQSNNDMLNACRYLILSFGVFHLSK